MSSSTFASRRSSARGRAAEGSENEPKVGVDPPAAPLPSRHPLISIQDPFQGCCDRRLVHHPSKGGGATPKSGQTTPVRSTPRGLAGFGGSIAGNSGHLAQYVGARERAAPSRVMRAMVDAKDLAPVAVPHYELCADSNFWKDHNVQVLIRIRPLNEAEIALQGYRRCLVQESAQTVEWTGHPGARFTFDHVACETTSQENLFQIVGLPMVENCMSGYNSCMFAYGQTGSGKTYTMMGEIGKMGNMLSQDCGITPRIFEYLFTRIREEENSRSSEKLRYSCKCSFLEIYNEQITDLLEPSSTNLQLREDIENGVYVENLKEHEVSSVKDVLELLLQGAANRKMAATYMNSESSRSHSVFTCVIESRWERDSMSHLRYGRLNLVDLAGSERQKSSGAEGERLKEAANINRSLSTLGLVIMTLVDIANGKNRHVPYRDSRLTFLLQDSLGGNSKTTIVANISPSICSINETLSTLKFAQRAKLIQNNAKVNEGTSGDVISLQRQIQKLKDQLALLADQQNVSKTLCPPSTNLDNDNSGGFSPSVSFPWKTNLDAPSGSCLFDQKIKYLENALSRALRREKIAEAEIRRLEAEIKHSNLLVQPKENEMCHTADRTLCTQIRDCYDNTIHDVHLHADQTVGVGGTPMFSFHRNADEHENIKEPSLFDNGNEDGHRFVHHRVEMARGETNVQVRNDIPELLQLDEWRGSDFVENSLLRSKNEEPNDHMRFLTEENSRLKETIASKDAEICAVSNTWEKAVADLTQFLIAGCKSLEDASEYIESLKSSFPLGTLSINEHVERAIKVSFEKEMVIADLQGRLEAAKQMSLELELKLDCLKGATLAITEVQKLKSEKNIDELCSASVSSCENDKKMQELEILLNSKEAQRVEAERCADAAFSVIKKMYDTNTMEPLDVGDIKFMIREILHEDSLEKNQALEKGKDPEKSGNEIFNVNSIQWPKCKMFEHDGNQEPNIEDNSSVERTVDIHEEGSSVELWQIVRDLEAKIENVHAGFFESEKVVHLKPNNVMDELEEKTNQADRLLLKFEEAQEVMEEAENMIKMLINVNEDVTIERDWWRKVSQEELAARILLLEELHRLEASKSSAQRQYNLFHDQIVETIEEISDQISSLKLSFQHMERTIAELNPFLVNALSLGKELLGCIGTSRSFLMDLISERKAKDHQFFTLSHSHIGGFLKQFKNLSLTSLEMEHFNHCTSPTPNCTHMNVLKNCETFEAPNTLLQNYQRVHSNFQQSREVLNVSEEVDAMVVTPGYSKLNVRRENEAASNQFLETLLEKENLDLKHDMNLVHEMFIKLAADCCNFIKDMNFHGVAQTYANIHLAKQNTETGQVEWLAWHKNVGDSWDNFKGTSLLHDILQDNAEVCLTGEDDIFNESVTAPATDIEVLYNEIQQLKHKFFISLNFSKDHEDQMLCRKNKVKEMLTSEQSIIPMYDDENRNNVHAKTEFGNLLIQRINELDSKFHNLGGFRELGLQGKYGNLKDQSLLNNLFESISSIEAKVCILLKQWSRSVVHTHDLTDDFSLKKELARKDGIIKGLLFDLRLLQESTSSFQDFKVKMEETCTSLDMVQEELERKKIQLADALSHQEVLVQELAKSEVTLSSTISKMEHANEICFMLSEENSGLRVLLENEQVKNNHIEELLEEKNIVIDGLEKEIISIRSSAGAKLVSSFEDIMDEMEKVSNERDNIQKEMCYLNDRLEMTITLADERDAIAAEARQIAEVTKAYAQEKEEEIKILEHSIEVLEATIDVLEKKVSDMKEEVESHHSIRKQLELKVEYMIERVYKAENDVEKLTTDISCSERECLLKRQMDDGIMELFEARREIKKLEMEITQKNEEITRYEKYISELVLHSEAQSSLYQDKYKTLSEMILDVKIDASALDSSGSIASKVEKSSARTRGSRSPFRCISSMVQQMNLEKEHELSLARNRIEELEALAASRQKEVCELTARLAAVDSMTHDVIRDLLGVKLDLTKYANLIDQEELQKLVTRAHEIKDETDAKDMEILHMKRSINKLMDERKSLLEDINKRRTDMLAQEVLIEQLRQRDQMITTKNEILKMNKSDLQRRIVALDEVRSTKLSMPSNSREVQTTSRRLHEH